MDLDQQDPRVEHRPCKPSTSPATSQYSPPPPAAMRLIPAAIIGRVPAAITPMGTAG
ncbi:MAG TPA: hypothetical protein VGQ26_02055 [Streptosporangiaceae bacterium]|jgi:hypothetical protein|nr:hypothetical protein [Streptosporangiaceae bacterium]